MVEKSLVHTLSIGHVTPSLTLADGGSMITIDVMLARTDEFRGGEFQASRMVLDLFLERMIEAHLAYVVGLIHWRVTYSNTMETHYTFIASQTLESDGSMCSHEFEQGDALVFVSHKPHCVQVAHLESIHVAAVTCHVCMRALAVMSPLCNQSNFASVRRMSFCCSRFSLEDALSLLWRSGKVSSVLVHTGTLHSAIV